MGDKKRKNKNKKNLNKSESLITRNIQLDIEKVNPLNFLSKTKKKLSSAFNDYKKQKEKERARLEIKRKKD